MVCRHRFETNPFTREQQFSTSPSLIRYLRTTRHFISIYYAGVPSRSPKTIRVLLAIELSYMSCASLHRRTMKCLEKHTAMCNGTLGTIKVTEDHKDFRPETHSTRQQPYSAGPKSLQIFQQICRLSWMLESSNGRRRSRPVHSYFPPRRMPLCGPE